MVVVVCALFDCMLLLSVTLFNRLLSSSSMLCCKLLLFPTTTVVVVLRSSLVLFTLDVYSFRIIVSVVLHVDVVAGNDGF